MFTTKNYFEKIKSIDFDNFPENLQEAYEFVMEVTENHKTWGFYEADSEIKATVDQYLADLSDYYKDQKPAKKETPVKKKRPVSIPTSKEPTEEQARNAAKELIKSYVLKGTSIDALRKSSLGVSTPTYSASIRNNHIHVNEVNGKVFIRTFLLKSIYDEIVKEYNISIPDENPDKYKNLAWETAKKLIRPYVKEGSGYKTLLTSSLGRSGGGYSAEIRSGKIYVTAVEGKSVNFSFPVQSVYEAIQNELPARKNTAKPKKEKTTTPAKKASPRSSAQDIKPVERIDDEVRFIKRFVLLHGKTKTKGQILNFINALQKAILEKRIRKTSPYSRKIEYIQDSLITLYNRMGEAVVVTIRKENLEDLLPIAGSEAVRLSVSYMKRYIGIQGKYITKEKAVKLYNIMETAIKKGKISGNDPYMKKMKVVVASLRKFATKARKNETLQIHETVLNGINEALDGCKCCTTKSRKKKDTLQGIDETLSLQPSAERPQNTVMNSMDFVGLEFDTLGFMGKWKELMGDPCEGFTAMVYSKPKMGKSYLCVEWAGYLARHHGNTLYVAKEEKLDATLQKKLNDKNVKHPNLFVSDYLPHDLSPYQFIFLDSVNKLGLAPEDLENIQAENPGKSFIYIFQTTKTGNFRGANTFQHDVDIVIEIPEKGKAVQIGRFNQGGEMEIFA